MEISKKIFVNSWQTLLKIKIITYLIESKLNSISDIYHSLFYGVGVFLEY